MKKFNHFILTRFNLAIRGRIALEPEWLNHRFELFERFCYPSVVGQSNQNFKWLVFFDSRTPEVFKNKVREYSQYQNFVPVYTDGYKEILSLYKKAILNHLEDGSEYLITTRLDNDDAIFKDFVKTIQDNFNEQEFEFISFSNGYVWHNQKIYSYKYLANPFTNLIEKINGLTVNGIKTAQCINHTKLALIAKQLNSRAAWLQVIHENNEANRVRGIRKLVKSPQELSNDFSIAPELFVVQENLLSYWKSKLLSLIKVPIELVILRLNKRTKQYIKKMLFQR